MAYFKNIKRGIKTTIKGLSLTLKHFWAARKTKGPLNVQDDKYFNISEGYVTLQYPHEKISVPEIGRYQLDCEIDDCIVCDKCAKICPVDCIEIEAIKSPELIRTTSDGSPVRLHAAKFDIDMAKCCFCGLCTTVCPTECLTMNSEYDYSVLDVSLLNMAFANLSEKEAEEKRNLYTQFVAEKEAAKLTKTDETPKQDAPSAFKPKVPVAFQPKPKVQENEETSATEPPRKPIFSPKKPIITGENEEISEDAQLEVPKQPFAPKKPIMAQTESTTESPLKPKPIFTPKKPTIVTNNENSNPDTENTSSVSNDQATLNESLVKPKFVPKKPSILAEKPVPIEALKFVPKSKPQQSATENIDDAFNTKPDIQVPEIEVIATPKSTVFVPKQKPTVAKSENETEQRPATFVPKQKPEVAIQENITNTKPAGFTPKAKPEIAKIEENTQNLDKEIQTEAKTPAKFVPKLKPKS